MFDSLNFRHASANAKFGAWQRVYLKEEGEEEGEEEEVNRYISKYTDRYPNILTDRPISIYLGVCSSKFGNGI